MTRPRWSHRRFPLLAVFSIVWRLTPVQADAATTFPEGPSAVPHVDAIDGVWEPLAMFIGPREGHTVTYDPVRKRIIVIGGAARLGSSGTRGLIDCWALSLEGTPAWSRLVTVGPYPQKRYGHSAVYDPVGDRIIVFGGISPPSTYLDDCWSLSLQSLQWSSLSLVGPPGRRAHHAAVYDPVRQRMWVLGGYQQDFGMPGQLYADCWGLELSGTPQWISYALAPGPPPGDMNHSAIYDPVADRAVLFGGYSGLWAVQFGSTPAWAPLAATGGPPAPRASHAAVYDPGAHRMLVFGGELSGGGVLAEAWALTLGGSPAWSALPAGPASRARTAAAFDPVAARMIVVGGSPPGSRGSNNTWALDVAGAPAWAVFADPAAMPDGVVDSPPAYDPVRDAVALVIGGETWQLSLASRTWTQLPAPAMARTDQAMVYDPVRDRLLTFGGTDGGMWLNDVLALDLAAPVAWTPLSTTGTPPSPRSLATMVYDAARDRLIVFGGYGTGGYDDKTYALTLSGAHAWSAIGSGAKPPGREGHVAVLDPARDRMVIHGGIGASLSYLTDTWSLALSGSIKWTQRGSTPPPAGDYGAVHDPPRDRIVLLRRDGTVWVIPLATLDAWSPISPVGGPPPLRGNLPAYDPNREILTVTGGGSNTFDTGESTHSDTWGLGFASPLDVAGRPPAPLRLTMRAPWPNPAMDHARFAFDLSEAARVSVAILDVSGRRVRMLMGGVELPAGSHAAVWDLRDEAGRPVSTGLYLARVETERGHAARRLVIAR